MGIGGNAFNNGVRFMSDHYTAKFIMKKDGSYTISSNKRPAVRGLKKYVYRIPLIKGLFSLFNGSFLIPTVIIISLITDFFPTENRGDQIDTIMMILTGIVSLICWAYVLKTIVYKSKNTWTFHGAEHKTIYAYENDMELTLENVRKCPRIARRCGTNLIAFLLLFVVIFSFFIDHASIILILSHMLAYELFDMENGDKLPVISLFFKLGHLFQQKISTREPSDAQLVAAIDTINTLIDLEKQNDS